MERFDIFGFNRSRETAELPEPTILDHGDPVTVKLTQELEERKRRLRLSEHHPVGL